MNPEELKSRNLENEFNFSMSRSSGPGSQNINKLNTKVELRFSILNTLHFSETEKDLISAKLKKKINKEGELILISQSERTQLMNKKVVTEKFYNIISKVLTTPVRRRSTRPTLSSVIKRLDGKRNQGYRKKLRKQTSDSSE